MPKPTKAQLIEIRKSTYRDQMPAECCGTCEFFYRTWKTDATGQCHAIRVRDVIQFLTSRNSPMPVTGKCDLYEPKGK